MPDYCGLIMNSNGVELFRGMIRVFGAGDGRSFGIDAVAWNAARWKHDLGIQGSVVLWGETVFGDQFGFDTNSLTVLFYECERRRNHTLPYSSVQACIRAFATRDPAHWVDTDLVAAAQHAGLIATSTQHLGFRLPLMLGGSDSVDNLEVVDSGFHMDLLGQFSAQVRDASDGKRVNGFFERDG